MTCTDCPEGIMLPEDMHPDDPTFGNFFKGDFIELMTPVVKHYVIELEVAVPIEIGQSILDSARTNGVEHAQEEAGVWISDLSTVADFFKDEIQASIRVLELDGYDAKVTVREVDAEGDVRFTPSE